MEWAGHTAADWMRGSPRTSGIKNELLSGQHRCVSSGAHAGPHCPISLISTSRGRTLIFLESFPLEQGKRSWEALVQGVGGNIAGLRGALKEASRGHLRTVSEKG